MPKSRSGTVELPELLTVDQVCAYLSMDDSTLRRHRRTGLFPAPDVVLSGRFPRWYRSTLAAYLADPPSPSGVMRQDQARSIRRTRLEREVAS